MIPLSPFGLNDPSFSCCCTHSRWAALFISHPGSQISVPTTGTGWCDKGGLVNSSTDGSRRELPGSTAVGQRAGDSWRETELQGIMNMHKSLPMPHLFLQCLQKWQSPATAWRLLDCCWANKIHGKIKNWSDELETMCSSGKKKKKKLASTNFTTWESMSLNHTWHRWTRIVLQPERVSGTITACLKWKLNILVKLPGIFLSGLELEKWCYDCGFSLQLMADLLSFSLIP